MTTRKVDVAIIGAGTAGLSARREVAKVTDDYVVIDDGELGTTCARVGCMPSKALIQAANDFHHRHKLETYGVSGVDGLAIDRDAAMAHMRVLRDRFVGFVKRDIEKWSETHLIRKRAKFAAPNALDLGDETVEAKRIIIAAGSSPVLPKPWRELGNRVIDTDSFFELERLPDRVAVIGLGVIGVELGQALARLGVKVVGVSMDKRIGGLSDPRLQECAANTICTEITTAYASADIQAGGRDDVIVTAGDRTWTVDLVLASLGRAPNLGGLGLADIGLALNERGVPIYDKGTLRIDGADIYIAGDALADRNLLHEAADEGRIAGYNAVRSEDQCFQRRTFIAVTFSDPEIAIVGRTFADLTQSGEDFVTGVVSFEDQGRAVVMGENKGALHLYADRRTGELLGAEMIAPHAEHFAHQLAWLISMSMRVQDILALPFYHPVLEEGVRTAFRDLASKVEQPPRDIDLLMCQEPPVGDCL